MDHKVGPLGVVLAIMRAPVLGEDFPILKNEYVIFLFTVGLTFHKRTGNLLSGFGYSKGGPQCRVPLLTHAAMPKPNLEKICKMRDENVEPLI